MLSAKIGKNSYIKNSLIQGCSDEAFSFFISCTKSQINSKSFLTANRADQGGKCPRSLWSYAESCCCKDGCCWDKCVVYDLPPEICVTGTPGITWVYNAGLGYHQGKIT